MHMRTAAQRADLVLPFVGGSTDPHTWAFLVGFKVHTVLKCDFTHEVQFTRHKEYNRACENSCKMSCVRRERSKV